jgi:hypothetical protein
LKVYRLVLGVLCVWRITHFLQAEDGPCDIVVHARRFAGERFWGKLMDCFYCLSVWVSVPFALLLGKSWCERTLLWPSLSAGAILLERVTKAASRMPLVPFAEESSKEE